MRMPKWTVRPAPRLVDQSNRRHWPCFLGNMCHPDHGSVSMAVSCRRFSAQSVGIASMIG